MRDWIVFGALVVGLAVLVTAHVALVARLAIRGRPRWRGAVALVVPPLGVIWALRAGWYGLAGVWIGSVLVYVAALIAARS